MVLLILLNLLYLPLSHSFTLNFNYFCRYTPKLILFSLASTNSVTETQIWCFDIVAGSSKPKRGVLAIPGP